jgi:hypothetical protein
VKAKTHPSVIAFFCEDIRPEQSGTVSLIGIVPDNMNVPQVPGAMAKLAIYIRGSFPASKAPAEFAARLELPWAPHSLPLGQIAPADIAKAATGAQKQGNHAVGLIISGFAAPFMVPQVGRIFAVVKIGNQEWRVGSLNIQLAPPVQQPTAPTPAAKKPKRASSRKSRR